MYVNKKKIEIGEAIVLKDLDEIHFGLNIPRNEFRYIFHMRNNGAILEKTLESHVELSHECPSVPPLKRPKITVKHSLSDDARQFDRESSTPPFDTSSPNQQVLFPRADPVPTSFCVIPSTDHLNPSALNTSTDKGAVNGDTTISIATPSAALNASTEEEVNDLFDDIISRSDEKMLTDNRSSSLIKESMPKKRLDFGSDLKPSPLLSNKCTDKEVDDLFDDIISKTNIKLLDEAIFGESSSSKTSSSLLDKPTMDGATIQVMAAQDQMEGEKHELLSSIEALKSELAAKNELIAKKDEKTEDESIVSSMQEEFTCTICQELFIRSYTLPCAHSFCECCIKEWMKTKRQKDCPICRKQITSEPVHSLVLDNVISKMEAKLSKSEKEERERTKEQHKKFLGNMSKSTICQSGGTSSY